MGMNFHQWIIDLLRDLPFSNINFPRNPYINNQSLLLESPKNKSSIKRIISNCWQRWGASCSRYLRIQTRSPAIGSNKNLSIDLPLRNKLHYNQVSSSKQSMVYVNSYLWIKVLSSLNNSRVTQLLYLLLIQTALY